MRLNTEQFHHRLSFTQFDTATLITPSFGIIKARGCKQRFKSDPPRIQDYFQYYYTVV